MTFKYIILSFLAFVSTNCLAQKDTISRTNKTINKEVFEVPSVKLGVGFCNLLDLYEGTIQQWNGFDDIDLSGSKGDNTNFDIAYGLLLSIPVSLNHEIDIDLSTGKMTSHNTNQYVKTKVSMLDIHYCRYLTKYKSPNTFNTRLFVQIGLGATSYKAERYFVKDDGLFSKTDGICLNNAASFGCLFNINERIQLNLQTGVVFNYADGFDGYDNQSVGDIMLKSGVGVRISL